MVNILGYQLALLEIFLFFIISRGLKTQENLSKIPGLVYYWVMFTIMTGIWELSFVTNYNYVIDLSKKLILGKEHVWTNNYSISNLNPQNFSELFYSEYGAYADREYMTPRDNWSRVIEGSHCLECGLFCLIGILYKINGNLLEYLICVSVGMGSQLMNSILYMINYFHQTQDSNNINFSNSSFPCGKFLEHRIFMYINIFWTIMPLYVILKLTNIYQINDKREMWKKYFKFGHNIS